jgi:GNAT superfamily N-acetyltransferase
MSSFRVVPFTPDRLSDLEPLWSEYLEGEGAVEARRTRFRWLTEQNPSLDGDCPYYLLLDGDRVIGMHGHMPQQFSVNGQRQRFYLAHDDLLAAECRGKGLGKVMLGGVAEQQKAFAGALWHNPPNRKLYAKCGWTDLSELIYLMLVVDPRRFVSARLGDNPLTGMTSSFLQRALAARDALRRVGRSSAYPVTDVERFDERFDALFDRAAPGLGISAVRDSRYLNWKFVDKPENRYRRLAAVDSDGEVRGYVVVSREVEGEESVGRVIDLLGDPEHPDALDGALRRGLDWLRSQGVSSVTTVGSPRAIAHLRRFGFVNRPVVSGFMFIHWESRFDLEFVSDIGNWYITASDADGDSWNQT